MASVSRRLRRRSLPATPSRGGGGSRTFSQEQARAALDRFKVERPALWDYFLRLGPNTPRTTTLGPPGEQGRRDAR